jgi:hypothetical protein
MTHCGNADAKRSMYFHSIERCDNTYYIQRRVTVTGTPAQYSGAPGFDCQCWGSIRDFTIFPQAVHSFQSWSSSLYQNRPHSFSCTFFPSVRNQLSFEVMWPNHMKRRHETNWKSATENFIGSKCRIFYFSPYIKNVVLHYTNSISSSPFFLPLFIIPNSF